MIMADILMWFLVVAGTYLVLIGYWLTAQGLFPAFVDGCRRRIEGSPFRQALVGLGVAVPVVIGGIAGLAAPNPGAKLLGAMTLLSLILVGIVGATGIAAQIGSGLASPVDERQAWRRVLRGGMVLGLTFILPLVGWFLILPGTLLMGIGAVVLGRKRLEVHGQPA